MAVTYGKRAEDLDTSWTPDQIELRYYWMTRRRNALVETHKTAVLLALGEAFRS